MRPPASTRRWENLASDPEPSNAAPVLRTAHHEGARRVAGRLGQRGTAAHTFAIDSQ
jgi:hypothetical protein